jgi:deoxyribose-phosphate aldolase
VVRLHRPDELAKRIHNTIVSPETTLDDLRGFYKEAKDYKFGAVVVQGSWVGT